jgi:SWI/SNF-related matrix-associated actin-dependent regulator 1 of chromatin subfamily A
MMQTNVNKKPIAELSYVLKLKLLGLEKDGITPKRIPYVGIEVTNVFTSEFKDEIFEILKLADIKCDFVYRNEQHAPHVQISVGSMFSAIRVLEDANFSTKSYVPFPIISHIEESIERDLNRPSDDDIINKLGHNLWNKLRAFQKTAVRKSVAHKSIMIADPMGAGKTLESICVTKFYDQHWPALIVCPGIVRNTWKNELMKWIQIPSEDIFIVKASKCITSKKFTDDHKFLIISYDLLSRPIVLEYLLKKRHATMILDESHYIKTRTAKRSIATSEIIKHATIRIALSGTPFSYPCEMFKQISVLYPKLYPYFFNTRTKGVPKNRFQYFYANRYCQPTQVRIHGRVVWEFKGYTNWVELNAVLSTLMIRRQKKRILHFLPKKMRSSIILEPFKQNKLNEIQKLLKGPKKSKKKQVENEIKTQNPEKIMEAWRLTCSYKIPMVLDFIKQFIIEEVIKKDQTNNVLIFAHHATMRNEIQELLLEEKISFFTIDGTTSQKNRAIYEDEFQNQNKYRVAILSITACATGLTLTKANVAVFTEIMFSPDVVLQAEARIHRISQERHVNIYYLLSGGTNDDINFGLITKKERKSTEILDGEQNIIYSKRIKFDSTSQDMASLLLMPPKKQPTNTKQKNNYKRKHTFTTKKTFHKFKTRRKI